jgi:putative transcriptional regulator
MPADVPILLIRNLRSWSTDPDRSSRSHTNKKPFEQLTESWRGAGEIKCGALKPARVFHLDPKNDLAKVRGKLRLSQAELASLLGISADTLQNWEQGRREPTGPAKVLLKIALKHPHLLVEVAQVAADARRQTESQVVKDTTHPCRLKE